MRRRQFSVYRYDDQPGDIMFVNGSGRVVVSPPGDIGKRMGEGFTPYGVVVVPSSHDTYGDGTMGVMSLRNTGYIPFGPYGHDPVFDCFRYEYGFDRRGWKMAVLDKVGPSHDGGDGSGYCPVELTRRIAQNIVMASDLFTEGMGSCNPSLKYNPEVLKDSDESSVSPNIYNADGTMNPSCVADSGNWFIFDYDGFGNTRRIYERYGSGWNNRYDDNNDYHVQVDVAPGEYPIIERAVNFDVRGRWYLPALGEMQYMVAMYKRIQDTLSIISGRVPGCEPILDAYFDSTIVATSFRKNNETEDKERDRCSGVWFDCSTSNPSISIKYYMTSFGDDKNRTLRGRFMCRYSYRSGFKSML